MVERPVQFTFEERAAESPLVERIWYTQSAAAGSFISTAATQWELVVMVQQGEMTVTLHGPETKATPAPCPADAEFWAVRFHVGTFMAALPNSVLVDAPINLPMAAGRSFWLQGATWEVPTFDNADVFVERLVREALLVQEPVVAAVLQQRPLDLSLRTIQRRFVYATGLTYGALDQIQRAEQAVALLEQGVSILDTVDQLGYADQPHLTRSLKRFMGQTPAQLLRRNHT
ncbi:MAG: helix-turn-helix domain-containing protein [Caldilineaceae bacterium]